MPSGKMSAQAFREWLLESNIATGLDVGVVHVSAKTLANHHRRGWYSLSYIDIQQTANKAVHTLSTTELFGADVRLCVSMVDSIDTRKG